MTLLGELETRKNKRHHRTHAHSNDHNDEDDNEHEMRKKWNKSKKDQHKNKKHKHWYYDSKEQKQQQARHQGMENESVAVGRLEDRLERIGNEMKKVRQRLDKMETRCFNNTDCPKGTCCLDTKRGGRCRLPPRHPHQRCNQQCRCAPGMHCVIKQRGNRREVPIGKCVLDEMDLHLKGKNFIPQMLKRLNKIKIRYR